jgi:hypothetical protein
MKFRRFRIIIAQSAFVLLMASLSEAQIFTFSGFVYDESGAPVADADLDFDDALTGRRLYTPNDNTDQDGFFRLTLLAGTYHISFAPPIGTNLLGKQIFNYQLNQSQIVNVTLIAGRIIRGTARDSLGNPVSGIDFDIDTLGGGRVYTPNDNSDSVGAYWLVSPPGMFRFRLSPPAGSHIRGVERDSVTVVNDTVINFMMPRGRLLAGRITDSAGSGLDSIQIDLRNTQTGQKVFVSFNETDSLGNYSIAVPDGMYNLRFTPPYGSHLVAVQVDSIYINSDLTWNQILRDGVLVNCLVTDSAGAALAGVDFDFTDESTNIRAFTPFDITGIEGRTIVSLVQGVYTIRVDPPPGALFDRVTLTSISVSNDTSIAIILPEVDRVAFGGRVIGPDGSGLGNIDIGLRSSITGLSVSLSNNTTNALGYFDTAVPRGTFDVSFSPRRGSRYVGMRLLQMIFEADTLWGDVALDTGVIFGARVLDSQGIPVADVDFDFITESNGVEAFTPNDNTDGVGTADITLPAGLYTIVMTPKPGSTLHIRTFHGINIASDSNVVIIMSNTEGPLPQNFMLKQNSPNPFNEMTSIAYTLLRNSDVSITIYNALGQRVRVMNSGFEQVGNHVIFWDGKNSDGKQAASGLYFYQLNTSYGSESKKMSLVK